jgi:Zn-dependent protease/CBS domain-containing protein
MPTRSALRIGTIFGIPIYLHFSWLLIFGLITYFLDKQFAGAHPNWTSSETKAVALATSLLYFASILFHELAHSVIAMRYKIRVHSIMLFLFGGVARIGRDPSKAIQEFNIAIAGPISSYLLSAFFLFLNLLSPQDGPMGVLTQTLWQINFAVATFNLFPGFPLDGGRIFRAAIWGATKDFVRATRIASISGQLMAYGIMGLGVWYVIAKQDWQSGLWLGLIGYYIQVAASESVSQIAIRQNLAGLRAADVMNNEVPTINRNTTLAEYYAEASRTGRRFHLVVTDDRLVGTIHVGALSAVPRDEWDSNSIQAVMTPRERISWAAPEEPLTRLLERLMAAGVQQMPVVSVSGDDDAQVVGIVTHDSILRVLQTRAELGTPVVAAVSK